MSQLYPVQCSQKNDFVIVFLSFTFYLYMRHLPYTESLTKQRHNLTMKTFLTVFSSFISNYIYAEIFIYLLVLTNVYSDVKNHQYYSSILDNTYLLKIASASFFRMLHVAKVLRTRSIPRIIHGSSKPVALTVLHLLFLWQSIPVSCNECSTKDLQKRKII